MKRCIGSTGCDDTVRGQSNVCPRGGHRQSFSSSSSYTEIFKDIQAPLGKLPLMGVGGISKENAKEFFENGASYLGLGSGMFNKQDIEELNVKNLAQSMKELLAAI